MAACPFHEALRCSGILPGEESERSTADATSAAPCWEATCDSFDVHRSQTQIEERHGLSTPDTLSLTSEKDFPSTRCDFPSIFVGSLDENALTGSADGFL